MVSACRKSSRSPAAAAAPALRQAARPDGAVRVRAPAFLAHSAVPSVEPPSTTTTSTCTSSWSAAETASAMAEPSLYAGMTTDSSERSVTEAAAAVGSGEVSNFSARPRNRSETIARRE
eukprot:scaffold7576_cov114-Isochrysis_galbana.AAC.2